MKCPRCLNTDRTYFYKGSRGWYCRKCISFGRVMLEEEEEPVRLAAAAGGSEEYILRYPLTAAQAEIASRCAGLIDETDVLLHCVCGAGKTELVVFSIAKMLKAGKKVCFAIPRRQVVLELRERLAGYFPKAAVIAVCGGHTSVTDGDLIICTTHQLYRYYRAFDLLILDETDAFPFRGNDVLHGIAETACRGRRIYLTATPDDELMKQVREGRIARLCLNVRPHGHPLPVPRLVRGCGIFLLLHLVSWIRRQGGKPVIVFVPSLKTARNMHLLLRLFFPCSYVTAKTADKDRIIEVFRARGSGVLVATTILERGTTVPGVRVAVYRADHKVFDEAGLIQMAGRAGRTFSEPDGEVLFLLGEKSRTAEKCVRSIRECNRSCAA